ncbi:MAG TPA: His/Gly/Thr/Pro-type tRNA ligase C-terminal domain-containing protein [bacterium]|nr:His/Gly/Thr/Pro-type tRNA ligase C-terminal domain-containing protein [bacterium]
MAEKIKLTSREQDYSQWYLDVAQTGELFEYSPTPGCITFLPKSTDIWQRIRAHIDAKIRVMGVQNVMLPMLVPMEFFMKEADHVEGFAPEIATVTRVGDKELDAPLGLRPTSETMFCDFFRKRLRSYRDLPILCNQWCNILRWEKRTRPFLRTAEFHWQEGHTLHRTRDEAWEFVLSILHDVYIDTIRNLLAIDGIAGRKSESEKFAGGDVTTTFEPMMSNGWALQICTSHLLAQGFMEGFDVSFADEDGSLKHPYYTSWGLSTRSIGGMISAHSDDRGLIIPPRISEYRAVILPIYGKDRDEETNAYARRVAAMLVPDGTEIPVKGESMRAVTNNQERVLLDLRNERVGAKITDWELSGYPVRIECGAREMDE